MLYIKPKKTIELRAWLKRRHWDNLGKTEILKKKKHIFETKLAILFVFWQLNIYMANDGINFILFKFMEMILSTFMQLN